MARRFLISGVVQGVGFRHAMVGEARRLKLRGFVRNRADGRVEAVADGEPAALAALEHWARHGPRGARVEELTVGEASPDQCADLEARFSQRPTA
jgi:acylphosphatase